MCSPKLGKSSYNGRMDYALQFVALIIGMVLHEVSHGLMANWLGDDTARMQGRLTLNPLAHIDPFATLILPLTLFLAGAPLFAAAKPVPFNPWAVRYGRWGAALVGAAGPISNLLIAGVCGLYLRFTHLGGLGGAFLYAMVIVNVMLAVFNSIPFPPLDGSRVVYAAVGTAVREVMDRIEQTGLVAVMLFVFVLYYLHLGNWIADVGLRISAWIIGVPPL